MTEAESKLLRLCVASGLLTEQAAAAAEREAAGGSPLRSALLRAGMPPEALAALEQAARSGVAPAAAPTVVAGGGEPPVTGSVVGLPGPAPAGAAPGARIGKYEILGEIGRGGMGAVFRARHPGLDRVVALKTLLMSGFEEATERFLREARTTARLGKHPNLVTVHDVDEADGMPFIVMDLVEGRSFDREIAEDPPSPRRAAEVVEQVARGLALAHANGVIHRDLKPANILVDRAGTPLVTDFGLAKDVSASGLSVAGQILGTPAYMAPEQAEGRPGLVDARSDVYGLGAILYEALAHREPFRADSVSELLRRVCEEDPAPPSRWNPAVPPELDIVALKCLAKRREERYASATELADDLRRWLDGEGILARPLPFHVRLARKARRHVLALSLAAAAAALAPWGAVAGYRARRESGERARLAEAAARKSKDDEARARLLVQFVEQGRGHLELARQAAETEAAAGIPAAIPAGRLDLAISAFRKALEVSPDAFEPNLLLARALRLRFEPDAWPQAERALALRPADPEARLEHALSGLWRFRSSLGFGQSIEHSGTPQLGRLSRAVVYADRSPEAANFLVSLRQEIDGLAGSPIGEAPAAFLRGVLLRLDGRDTEALEEVDRAIAADPTLMEAHRLRVELLCTLRRPEAAEACRRFLRLRPDDTELWLSLARVTTDVDEAMRAIDETAKLGQAPVYCDSWKAWVLYWAGRLKEASPIADRALEEGPDVPLAMSVAFFVRYERGDWGAAMDVLESWRKLTPDAVMAYANAAYMLYVTGRHEESLPGFERADRESNGFPVYRWCRGRALVLCGRYVEGAGLMVDSVAGADLDERTRKLLENQRKEIERRAAAIHSPVEAAKFTEGLGAMMLLAIPANASAERRSQFLASVRTLRDLAAELYEQAGEWKAARKANVEGGDRDGLGWSIPWRAARIETQRGRLDRAVELLREARGKGMVRLGAVELDARFRALRESDQWEPLKAEFAREP